MPNPGDLITADNQYEYCGLLMGSGTPYITEQWDGLFSIPSVQNSDVQRNDRDGVVSGVDLMGGRTLTGSILLHESGGRTAVQDRVEAFQSVMRPKLNEQQFLYQLPGRAKRYIWARPRKSDIPSNYELAHGLGAISVELFASDPRHYSIVEHHQTLTMAAGVLTVTVNVTNAGNWISYPRFQYTDTHIQGTNTGYNTAPIPHFRVAAAAAMDGVVPPVRDFVSLASFGVAPLNALGAGPFPDPTSFTNLGTAAWDMDRRTIHDGTNWVPEIKERGSPWLWLNPGVNAVTITRYRPPTNTGGGQYTVDNYPAVFDLYWRDVWVY